MKRTVLKNVFMILFGAALAAAAILYKSDPALFQLKERGSFEYVRNGEKLLDEGKYKQAVYYFEKALESSPESSDIRLGLAGACSRAGRAAFETGDYISAVTYFQRAFWAAPNKDTRYNLAIAHSKKALSEARDGKWHDALESYGKARLTAEESANVSINLAASLFNDAVSNYNEGHSEAAVLALKESILLAAKGRSYDFLGDIYYRRGDLEKAAFYWHKARSLGADDAVLGKKLARLERELEAARLERKVALPHFELKVAGLIPVDVAAISAILANAYIDIGGDLAYYPSSRTIVFLYPEKDFKDIFRLPATVAAFYDGNIRMPISEQNLAGETLKRYLYHEYAHSIVSAITRNNCPSWLNEGIAVREEYGKEIPPLKDIFKPLEVKTPVSLRLLEERFKEKDAVRASDYILAYSAVRFVAENWGMDSIRNILRRLGEGQHIANAVDDELLLTQDEFDKRWDLYLKNAV
jgi:tetratricopeptide (TPR) repeat protein